MNRLLIVLMLGALITDCSTSANAKPLSYPGGVMIMQENDQTGNTLSVDYTFDPHFALGIYAKRDIGGNDFYTVGPMARATSLA
jgi:hypothetical protein